MPNNADIVLAYHTDCSSSHKNTLQGISVTEAAPHHEASVIVGVFPELGAGVSRVRKERAAFLRTQVVKRCAAKTLYSFSEGLWEIIKR
jgi:hypothetical protein